MRVAVILLVAFPLAAQVWEDRELTPAELREDLSVLRAALAEGHPELERFTPRAQIERAFEALEHGLSRPASVLEFYRLLAPAVTAIRCGHTRLYPPDALLTWIDRKALWLPFDVEVRDGRVWVFRDYTSEDERLAASEILSINHVPAAKLLEAAIEAWSHDGDIETSRAWRVGHGGVFVRFLYPVNGLQAPFQVEYRSGREKRVLTTSGIARRRMRELVESRHPQDLRAPSSASATMLDDGKLAVLTLSSLSGATDEEPPRPVGEFVEWVFREMARRGSQALILDLRNNGGGNNELAKNILAHLVSEPFDYYREVRVNALEFSFSRYAVPPDPIPVKGAVRRPDGRYDVASHPNFGQQQPEQPHFGGRLYVIENGGTFSSAAELASLIDARRRAVFIGQESGGGYDGNNSGFMPRIVLPHSRIVLQLPLVGFRLAVGGEHDPRRGVRPRYPVDYSIEELLAGQDKEMDLAIELARGGR